MSTVRVTIEVQVEHPDKQTLEHKINYARFWFEHYTKQNFNFNSVKVLDVKEVKSNRLF